MKKKIIIDTDIGIDDAMALLLALKSPELDLVGVTTVFGNVNCNQASINALKLLELADRSDIPVAKGSDVPLIIKPHIHGTHVHGEDGLGNSNFSKPKEKILEMSAVQFIIKMILENPGEITLVPIGPLTNIALAIKLEPKIINLVKEVVMMGGAATVGGNATPVAEANIWQDPHAASIVFNAGLPLTMLGLDVTTKVVQTEDDLNDIYSANNYATNLIKMITPFYQDFYFKCHGTRNLHTHDPSAIVYILKPELFIIRSAPIVVEIEGKCAGQTVPDFKKQWNDNPVTNICVGVDAPGVLELIRKCLKS